LSIGGILVFIVYLTSLQTQIKVFSNMHSSLRNFQASVDRVLEILQANPEVNEKPKPMLLLKPEGKVELDGVVFGYGDARPVLRGVSISVRAGQAIAIVGPTGAGKTTLVNMIPRFHDPWEGRVLVDGRDVRDLQIRNLRQQIGLVLQEPFLFPASVAENIALGRPDATLTEIEAAAQKANAHEFIKSLPAGYDTILGERGANLSGGEKQRLAIARAFLKNAPILILDEPTSALDPHTESLLLTALAKLMAGRTTFIIAHRLSTVRQADRILVLQDGRITESGTHAELMARGKFYSQMHNIQFEVTTRS
jgi:ATP-binding cassette subfamily B protein/subfamily B ATP-binding cassette protein MsbA